MIIGVPREIKPQEDRVSMTPAGVDACVRAGHEVVIESGAGAGSGFTDEEYVRAGATILKTAQETFEKADMIVIDLHKPNMQPEHDTVKNLVYSGSDSNVILTMVGGKVLYENGVFHIGDTPEHIYEMARRETDRIVNG